MDGITAVSSYVVEQIPVSVDKEVGREVRQELLRAAPIDQQRTEQIQAFNSALGFDDKTKVFVVSASEFNAFALPDNSIFVFDEVIKQVETYPELAALLAHEYAHIKHRHGMKTLANALSRELLTELLTGGNKQETFISNSNQLLLLKNSRAFETEADAVGLDLLQERGINLNGMARFFDRMARIETENASQTPTYLSTHPHTEDRLDVVMDAIKTRENNFAQDLELEAMFKRLKAY